MIKMKTFPVVVVTGWLMIDIYFTRLQSYVTVDLSGGLRYFYFFCSHDDLRCRELGKTVAVF